MCPSTATAFRVTLLKYKGMMLLIKGAEQRLVCTRTQGLFYCLWITMWIYF